MLYSAEEKKLMSFCGKLGLSFIIILIPSIVYVLVFHLSLVIFSELDRFSVFIIGLGVFIGAMILIDILKASLTSPGYSTDLDPPVDEHRTCGICKHYKPARSHHCSVCEKCILEMDHHCPWINNCVGIGNKYYFHRFILWCILGGFYLTVTLCKTFFRISIQSWDVDNIDEFCRAMIKILFPLGFSVFLVVGLLMGFQSYLMLKNLTTLEYLSLSKANPSLCSRVLKIFSRSKKINNS